MTNDRSAERPRAHARGVVLSNLVKRYGSVLATDHVSLDVRGGEFVSLLGPSGSGKTTLLMLLAGFESADEGEILLGGRNIARLPPNKRDLGMVFQRYALFPHMTVSQNVAFPLRMRRVPRAEQKARADAALEMVKLTGLGDRMPGQLSGGQQQRVALARSIVFEPSLLLMDEPLGALDRKLRQHMQVELKELQSRLGATVLYVTHDQEEALAMSDRVAIVNEGRIEQLDAPRVLYDRPASAFVADFVGEVNFLDGRLLSADAAGCLVEAGGVRMAGAAMGGRRALENEAALIGIRPERLALTRAHSVTSGGQLAGTVRRSIFNGGSVTVHVDLRDGVAVRAVVGPNAAEAWLPEGTPVTLSAAPEDVLVFPGGR